MPDLHNHTAQSITTPSGFNIPARGSLHVSDATWVRLQTEPYTASRLRRGHLTCDPDKAPDPAADDAPLTREAVARMKRAELLDLAEAHGLEAVQFEGVKVDELREAVARIVFVDL